MTMKFKFSKISNKDEVKKWYNNLNYIKIALLCNKSAINIAK